MLAVVRKHGGKVAETLCVGQVLGVVQRITTQNKIQMPTALLHLSFNRRFLAGNFRLCEDFAHASYPWEKVFRFRDCYQQITTN
jgi:hypothetical protein